MVPYFNLHLLSLIIFKVYVFPLTHKVFNDASTMIMFQTIIIFEIPEKNPYFVNPLNNYF